MFNNEQTSGIGTGVVIWQSKNTQVAQGGFTLDDASYASGAEVPAGIPIGYDEATRLAKVAKIGVAQASATNSATAYKVLKGHSLKVGDAISSGASATPRAITTIVTTDPDFDTVNVGTTMGVVITAGDSIHVTDLGVTGVKGLLYSNVIVGANGLADVSVVLRGTVYARRITPVPATMKASLPLIIFSDSF